MRIEQIQATLARFDQEELRKALDAEVEAGRMRRVSYRDALYYATGEARYQRES